MRKRKGLAFSACLVAGFLIVGAFLCQMVADPVPAVAAVPTPVGAQAGGGDWVMVTYTSATSWNNFTTTQTSPSQHAPAYTAADISWTVDISSSNTLTGTCLIQYSNDSSNWGDGVQLFTVTADETNIDQVELIGRYHRITCTETTTWTHDTLTMTIMGKLMN